MKPVSFPAEPMPAVEPGQTWRGYDLDADGQSEIVLYLGTSGRVNRIGYARNGQGEIDQVVELDAIDFAQCRHLVLILDGFGYDLVKAYRDAGHLRLFHPPSRVIAPYPALTDLSLADLFGCVPCKAFEAEYYDHKAGQIVGGSSAYLRGDNAPYNHLLQYRANMLLDAIGYLQPWAVFGKEANDAKRLFDENRTREMLAYFVSSAGVGTAMGGDGQRMCLERIDQLVHQVVSETRGATKVTLLADHGHSYTPGERIGLEAHIEAAGWRLTNRLRGEKDVAYIRFGLETYASFSTRSPAALAADLVGCEGVDLASYADGDQVIVLAPKDARAIISRKDGRFAYEATSGDPLELKAILATLKPDREGRYDSDELLTATADHVYPAPLQRIWRAHFALVTDPPDVIVSLADKFYSGSTSFGGAIKVASTHGGLNRRNSTTFIMSTAGPLPPLMRSADVPAQMKRLTGRTWPASR